MSFGVGWLQDQLRARFDIRGPIGEPFDVAPQVQVGMEARPSLPWEYGNARWLPVMAGAQVGNGGAGLFSSIGPRVVATSGRALVITAWWAMPAVTQDILIYTDGAFANPNIGAALTDARLRSAGSSFTPVVDCGLLTQNAAAALPALGTRCGFFPVTANQPFALPAPLVIPPGFAIDAWAGTANSVLALSMIGYLVPLGDLT